MRTSKSAPNLLKKAATSIKSKTDALRTKLIFVASLRRRLAMVCTMSRQIRALVTSDGRREKQARVVVDHSSKVLTMHRAMVGTSKEVAGSDHGGLFEVAMFEEGYHGYLDSTNSSLFDDDICYNDGEDSQDDDLDVDAFDGTSVIEIIRRDRMADGLEFDMEDDIDEACEMFIRRCRGRMNLSF